MISPDTLDTTVAGTITGVSIYSGDVPDGFRDGTFYDNDFYLCYTDLDILTANFDDNYGSYQPTLVYAEPTLDIDWTRHEWQPDIVFDTSWEYDGTSNFIMEFTYGGHEDGQGCVGRGWYTPVTGLALEADEKDAVTGGLLPYANWLRFTVTPSGAVESSSLGEVKAVFR